MQGRAVRCLRRHPVAASAFADESGDCEMKVQAARCRLKGDFYSESSSRIEGTRSLPISSIAEMLCCGETRVPS